MNTDGSDKVQIPYWAPALLVFLIGCGIGLNMLLHPTDKKPLTPTVKTVWDATGCAYVLVKGGDAIQPVTIADWTGNREVYRATDQDKPTCLNK